MFQHLVLFSYLLQPCRNNCHPSWPCGASGCPNWRGPPNSRPYYQGTYSWRGPNPSPGDDRRREDAYWSSNNVRMGVGYTSTRDLDMTIHSDRLIQGQESVHLGSGNYASRDLRAKVHGNVVDSTRELLIGVGNASGRDSNLIVRDNEFRGRTGSVDIGVGNRSDGPLKIVVAGNRWRNNSPQP